MKMAKQIMSLLLITVMLVSSFGVVGSLALWDEEEIFTFNPGDAKVHEGDPLITDSKISWIGSGNHGNVAGPHSVYFTVENATGGIYDVEFDAPSQQQQRYVDIIVGDKTFSIQFNNANGTLHVPGVELAPGENKIVFACHRAGGWAPDITGLRVKKVKDFILLTPADATVYEGYPTISDIQIGYLGNGGDHDGVPGPHSVSFTVEMSQAGSYDMQFILGTAFERRTLDVVVDGVKYTGGGAPWQNFIEIQDVELTAGTNQIIVGNYSGWAPNVSAVRIEKPEETDLPAPLDLSIDISDGAVAAAESENKFDITWNANVVLGEETGLEEINGLATFKEYGVIYGTSEEAVAAAADAGADTKDAKIKAFAKDEDIDVYTIFGFRLKNVFAKKARAAMFYITYEVDGRAYTVYSNCMKAVAEIA